MDLRGVQGQRVLAPVLAVLSSSLVFPAVVPNLALAAEVRLLGGFSAAGGAASEPAGRSLVGSLGFQPSGGRSLDPSGFVLYGGFPGPDTLDSSLPVFHLALLQDPVLLSEIDVVAYSSKPCINPSTVAMSTNGAPLIPDVYLVGDRPLFKSDLTLDGGASSIDSIAFSGCDCAGNCADALSVFAVRTMHRGSASIAPPGTRALLTFSDGAIPEEAVLLAIAYPRATWEELGGVARTADSGSPTELGYGIGDVVFQFQSLQSGQHAGGILSLQLSDREWAEGQPEYFSLARWVSGRWELLDSWIDVQDRRIEAPALGLGAFALTRGTRPLSRLLAGSGLLVFDNRPNPFQDETGIRFILGSRGPVSVRIFNAVGALVRVLLDRELAAGFQEIRWDGANQDGQAVATGTYFCAISTPGHRENRKVVLVR